MQRRNPYLPLPTEHMSRPVPVTSQSQVELAINAETTMAPCMLFDHYLSASVVAEELESRPDQATPSRRHFKSRS